MYTSKYDMWSQVCFLHLPNRRLWGWTYIFRTSRSSRWDRYSSSGRGVISRYLDHQKKNMTCGPPSYGGAIERLGNFLRIYDLISSYDVFVRIFSKWGDKPWRLGYWATRCEHFPIYLNGWWKNFVEPNWSPSGLIRPKVWILGIS